MDTKRFTDENFEMDQAIAAVLSGVQRFRLEWGALAAKLAFENYLDGDTAAARSELDAAMAALTAVAKTMQERLTKFIDDIDAERNPPEESTAASASAEAAAAPSDAGFGEATAAA